MTRDEYLHFPAMFAKRGTELPTARLDDEKVRQIRREYGPKTARQLADELGVSSSLVYKVAHRERWAHVR